MHIYLIGFMGSGKSTIGAALSQSTGRRLLDTDELIVERDGRDIPAIFEESGEPFFRKIEREALNDVASMDEGCIVSCGGGVVLSQENVELMQASGRIVWLVASSREILRRVASDTSRPLLSGKKTLQDIETMMEERHDAYAGAADITVDTDGMGIDEIVACIDKRAFV